MARKRATGPSAKERYYRELLAELATSGLTLREFARGRGIPESTFAWWKHVIVRRDRAHGSTNGNGATLGKLLPVHVVATTLDSEESKTLAEPKGEFVVRLRSGREVRVPPGFDASELKRLVAALEDAC